jgi:hypothetical protein
MSRPRTQYAKSAEVNIAYQVVGDGPFDLVLVPGFVSHVEVAWEQPRLAHLLNQLGAILSGHATTLVWLKVALTCLTPLVVSNFGVLSATHRRDDPS